MMVARNERIAMAQMIEYLTSSQSEVYRELRKLRSENAALKRELDESTRLMKSATDALRDAREVRECMIMSIDRRNRDIAFLKWCLAAVSSSLILALLRLFWIGP